MERETKQAAIGRRAFLKAAGAGTAAGAAAAAMGAAGPAAAEPARDDAAYRETEHVRRYYDLAAKF